MKLTIAKCNNRILFTKALRSIDSLYKSFSLQDIIDKLNNLPFVIENIDIDYNKAYQLFGDCCEFELESDSTINSYLAPWESEEYNDAMHWYNSLSEQDRNRVDVLVNVNLHYMN